MASISRNMTETSAERLRLLLQSWELYYTCMHEEWSPVSAAFTPLQLSGDRPRGPFARGPGVGSMRFCLVNQEPRTLVQRTLVQRTQCWCQRRLGWCQRRLGWCPWGLRVSFLELLNLGIYLLPSCSRQSFSMILSRVWLPPGTFAGSPRSIDHYPSDAMTISVQACIQKDLVLRLSSIISCTASRVLISRIAIRIVSQYSKLLPTDKTCLAIRLRASYLHAPSFLVYVVIGSYYIACPKANLMGMSGRSTAGKYLSSAGDTHT